MKRTLLSALPATLVLVSCAEQYRVGQRVLVEAGGEEYAAFVTEVQGRARYRVHYQGFDSRWDEALTVDRIRGRLAASDPMPAYDRAPHGANLGKQSSRTPKPYQAGDKVRVTRGASKYAATVLRVVSIEELLVRYDGFEAAFDEVVSVGRLTTKK